MRKLVYAGLLLLAGMTACKGGAEQTTATAEETSTAPIDTFYSPDWAFANLRGHVRQCESISVDVTEGADSTMALTVKTSLSFAPNGYITRAVTTEEFADTPVASSAYDFDFDSIGNLVSSSTSLNGRLVVNRDKQGYVTSFSSIDNSGKVEFKKSYGWDCGKLSSVRLVNDAQPVSIIDRVTYAYDTDGLLVKEIEESGDANTRVAVIETEYENQQVDSLGNWTRRDVRRTTRVYDVARSSKQRTLSDSTYARMSDTRTIVYY